MQGVFNNQYSLGNLGTVWLEKFLYQPCNRDHSLQLARKFVVRHYARPALVNHSHPTAATERNAATTNLADLCKALGARQYDVDLSMRARRLGDPSGHRVVNTVKDLLVDRSIGSMAASDVVTLCDSEYYVRDFSPYAGNVIAMYGLHPRSIGRRWGDSSWKFVTESVVEERVAGGAVYRHGVWRFDADVVVVDKWNWWSCVYDVVHLRSPAEWHPDRSLVVLVPACWISPLGRLYHWLCGGLHLPRLQRMTVDVVGDYLQVVARGVEPAVQFTNRTIPDAPVYELAVGDYQALREMASHKDQQFITANQALAYLRKTRTETSEGLAIAAAKLVSAKRPANYSAVFEYFGKHIVGIAEDADAAGLVDHVVPVTGHAYPTREGNNAERAVEGRVTSIANLTPIPAELRTLMQEFVEQLTVPLEPVTIEEVAANQTRPAQRAAAKEIEPEAGDDLELFSRSFIKMEAGKIGDPRVISTFGAKHNRALAPYAYAFAAHMKSFDWYAPGKSPSAIQERIDALVATGGGFTGLDASRMDGRVSPALHEGLLVETFVACFGTDHAEYVRGTLMKEVGAKARVKGAAPFRITGTASGSPITTIKNSLVSAFVLYAGNRESGLDVKQAFAAIPAVAGDDIIASTSRVEACISVADRLGMVFEVEAAPPSTIPFLSRYYSTIESGSVPNVKRVLGKLPICQGKTQRQRKAHLAAKLEALQVTDGCLPLLCNYSAYIRRRAGPLPHVRWDKVTDRGLLEKRSRGAYTHPGPEEAQRIIADTIGVNSSELRIITDAMDYDVEGALTSLRMILGADSLPDDVWISGN